MCVKVKYIRRFHKFKKKMINRFVKAVRWLPVDRLKKKVVNLSKCCGKFMLD